MFSCHTGNSTDIGQCNAGQNNLLELMKKIFQVHSYLLILTNQLRAYISSHLRAEAMRMWSWRLKQVAKAEQMLGAIFCTNVKWSNTGAVLVVGKILEALCGKRMYRDVNNRTFTHAVSTTSASCGKNSFKYHPLTDPQSGSSINPP